MDIVGISQGATDGRHLYKFAFADGRTIMVATCSPHQMGAVDMGVFTATLLRELRPTAACLVGIAAAVDSNVVGLGDVPFASQVISYNDISVQGGQLTFRTEGFQTDSAMLKAVGELRTSLTCYLPWQERCMRVIKEVVPRLNKLRRTPIRQLEDPRQPHLVVEVMGGGPFLLRDEEFRDSLRKLPEHQMIKVSAPVHPKLVSAEMESHGFMRAAFDAGVPASVAKGISDVGDEGKTRMETESGGLYRAMACVNATLAVLHAAQYCSRYNECHSFGSTPNSLKKISLKSFDYSVLNTSFERVNKLEINLGVRGDAAADAEYGEYEFVLPDSYCVFHGEQAALAVAAVPRLQFACTGKRELRATYLAKSIGCDVNALADIAEYHIDVSDAVNQYRIRTLQGDYTLQVLMSANDVHVMNLWAHATQDHLGRVVAISNVQLFRNIPLHYHLAKSRLIDGPVLASAFLDSSEEVNQFIRTLNEGPGVRPIPMTVSVFVFSHVTGALTNAETNFDGARAMLRPFAINNELPIGVIVAGAGIIPVGAGGISFLMQLPKDT